MARFIPEGPVHIMAHVSPADTSASDRADRLTSRITRLVAS